MFDKLNSFRYWVIIFGGFGDWFNHLWRPRSFIEIVIVNMWTAEFWWRCLPKGEGACSVSSGGNPWHQFEEQLSVEPISRIHPICLFPDFCLSFASTQRCLPDCCSSHHSSNLVVPLISLLTYSWCRHSHAFLFWMKEWAGDGGISSSNSKGIGSEEKLKGPWDWINVNVGRGSLSASSIAVSWME